MSAPTDRLALIEARHAEAGGGDGDKAWLIAEVKRLRREVKDWERVLNTIMAEARQGHR